MPTSRLESEIEKAACKAAAKAGWLVYKFVSPQKRGVPDRIFFRDGVTVLIEFKRPGGRTTRLQDMQIEKLQAAGIAVEVCDSIECAKEALEKNHAITHRPHRYRDPQ